MAWTTLGRTFALAIAATLLASCATTHTSTEDPREWSLSPQVEARKFYTSGLSVDDYVAGKPKGAKSFFGLYVFYLCYGLIEAGDEVRTEQCRRVFDQFAAAPVVKNDAQFAQEFAAYGEMIKIMTNQFLLEQGRFKEVEQNLLPYLGREEALVTFDRKKMNNARFRMVAAPILARAQRNLGGITEPVRKALDEGMGGLTALGAVLYPKSMSLQAAEREYLKGNYQACYDKVSRSSVGGYGLGNAMGALINPFDGTQTSMDRTIDVMYTRLQALCAYEAGRFDDAELSYQDLLKLEDTKHLRGIQRLAHYHLAQITLRKKNNNAATTHLKASIDALESERAAIDSEAGRLGYVTNKADIYAQLVDLLVQQGRDAEAFEYAERGKARALVDMLASKRSGGKVGAEGVYTRALRTMDAAEGDAVPVPAGTRSAATSRSAAVKQEIARTNPQLGSLLSVSALPTDEVRKHLRPNETLVEYFGEGDRLFAFVVTQKAVKGVKLDGKAVAEQAKAYRALLTQRSSRDYLSASKRLYDASFAPLLAHADTGPITVIPHGTLHYVPFASLHDGRNYLVQKSDVRLLPSASVLPFLTPRTAGGNGLLILGNPDLGNPQLDLPGAEQEARLLERWNKGAQVLLRRNASETALRRLGPQFKEIHFAMHGKFDSQNAMASGLYMAKDTDNDGILSVGELYDMQLNADLVVLSACETALGDVSHGDDMVGLNRGFLFAGARSIVSSLWEVDDQATRDLMVAFYQQRAKYGKAGGLRQAQLAVMKKYPHPYYWAAFQMSGLF